MGLGCLWSSLSYLQAQNPALPSQLEAMPLVRQKPKVPPIVTYPLLPVGKHILKRLRKRCSSNYSPGGMLLKRHQSNKCSRVAVKWQSPIEVQGIDVFYTSLANVALQFSYTILLHSSFAVKTLSLAMHSLVSQTVKVCMQDSTWRATAPPVILQHVILFDCMHDQPFVTWPGEAKALPI